MFPTLFRVKFLRIQLLRYICVYCRNLKICPFTKTSKIPVALYNHSRIHFRHVEEQIPRNKILLRMSVHCFSWSTNSCHFMEPKIPLPCSQHAGTCPHPQPDNSSLHLPILFIYRFNLSTNNARIISHKTL